MAQTTVEPLTSSSEAKTTKAKGYAAHSATTPLEPLSLKRREPGPDDVQIEILYCGVCHSDLHTVRNEWTNTTYPVVPGHEIVGRVTKVGTKVKKLKEGDLAAVGCMVDSCGHCEECKAGLENYCQQGLVLTYNSPDPHLGGMTYGGYSTSIVVNERFVLHVPKSLELAGVAPLLCAGITTYSPLPALEGRQGPEGGGRRPRRPGTHGGEIGECDGRACDAVYDFGAQA